MAIKHVGFRETESGKIPMPLTKKLQRLRYDIVVKFGIL